VHVHFFQAVCDGHIVVGAAFWDKDDEILDQEASVSSVQLIRIPPRELDPSVFCISTRKCLLVKVIYGKYMCKISQF